jgi:hypothetical protein
MEGAEVLGMILSLGTNTKRFEQVFVEQVFVGSGRVPFVERVFDNPVF